jgi:hypothetical protein
MTDKFEIRQAGRGDLDEIVRINRVTFDEIPLWKLMVQGADPDVFHEFLLHFTARRFEQPQYKYFVAVDIDNR